jgi:hypothetical protein
MGVPIAIYLVTFAGGAIAAARLLPNLAPGRVGDVAFFLVCGLLGVALSLIAIEIYEIVRDIDKVTANLGGVNKADVLASGLATILRDVGPVLGLAGAVYLLAPGSDDDDRLERADDLA